MFKITTSYYAPLDKFSFFFRLKMKPENMLEIWEVWIPSMAKPSYGFKNKKLGFPDPKNWAFWIALWSFTQILKVEQELCAAQSRVHIEKKEKTEIKDIFTFLVCWKGLNCHICLKNLRNTCKTFDSFLARNWHVISLGTTFRQW